MTRRASALRRDHEAHGWRIDERQPDDRARTYVTCLCGWSGWLDERELVAARLLEETP